MRGRQMKAAAETKVSAIQRSAWRFHCAMGAASIMASIGPGPPATWNMTTRPTAMRATSFTTASTAMAMTTPLCFSSTSRLRVPKMMVKIASPTATHAPEETTEFVAGPAAVPAAKAPKASVTDWSWSAM